jgi:hypothetical protein
VPHDVGLRKAVQQQEGRAGSAGQRKDLRLARLNPKLAKPLEHRVSLRYS